MSYLTCKIDNQGRIMLPSRWRKKHGILPDSELIVSFTQAGLVLQTWDQAVAEAQAMVRKLAPPGESLVETLLKERRREAKREATKARRRP